MEILLIHYSAPPVVGGVESVIAQHARLMANAGHSVRILAGRGAQVDPHIPFVQVPLADSLHPEILAVKAELDAGRVPKAFEELTSRLTLILDQAIGRAEIVICHNVCSLNKNLVLTAALKRFFERKKRVRPIIWNHDLAWTTTRYQSELHDGYPWDLLCTEWPGARQVVVSEFRQHELAELLGLPLERITVVPNGIDGPRFLKLEAQTVDFLSRIHLLGNAPRLLLPVRVTPRKNIELALRVLAELRKKAFPQAVLVVTGPLGPHNPANVEYFKRLTALREELGLTGAAHFLAELSSGFLPDEVISDFYRLTDALLMPSREEGFGLPVLEAGLAGLPVFCSDIPPLRSLGGDQAVYFSPDASPQEVAELIAKRLAPDPVYQLRQRVRTAYTWERVYEEKIAPLL